MILLEHARRKPLKYSDEQTRQTAWWFIYKFLPALVADEPTVEVREPNDRVSVSE